MAPSTDEPFVYGKGRREVVKEKGKEERLRVQGLGFRVSGLGFGEL